MIVEGRLAQTGRAVEQDVIRGVPSLPGGAEQDRQVRFQFTLTDVLVQSVRPQ